MIWNWTMFHFEKLPDFLRYICPWLTSDTYLLCLENTTVLVTAPSHSFLVLIRHVSTSGPWKCCLTLNPGGDIPHGEGWNGDHPDPARQLDRQAGHAARGRHHPRSERPRGRERPPRPAGAAGGLQRQHHAEGAAQLQGRARTSTGESSQRSERVLWSTEGGMRRSSGHFSRLTCGISECQAFENWAPMGSINNPPPDTHTHTIWSIRLPVDCSIPPTLLLTVTRWQHSWNGAACMSNSDLWTREFQMVTFLCWVV